MTQNGKTQPTAMLVLIALFAALLVGCSPKADHTSEKASPEAKPSDIDQQVDALMAKMTLEDKVGEMTQLTLDMLCVGEPYQLESPHRIDPDKMRKALVEYKVGSILNVGGHAYTREKWYELMTAIQKTAMEEKSTGIPVLYGIDAIHGANYTQGATLFPQQIGLAATWNPELAKEMGRITAYETRASAIPWTFSPVMDLGRDPRWPRMWETFGEDVHLGTEMGIALMQGYQGDDIGDPEHVAACLKHFLGYSVTLTGKDRTQAWVPERMLREIHLPAFAKAIEAGAATLMINSGEMNGIPVHINPKILTEILRNELGFEGLAVTDWEDIRYLFSRHRVATDYKEAIKMAINAGVDMSMVPTDLEFPVLLKELVEEGAVPMARIDESVRRILKLKFKLNLFEQPFYEADRYPDFASEKHAMASMEAALESITLMKNANGILPLKAGSKVLVTGPTSQSLNCLNGGWTHTWQGVETQYNTPEKLTIFEALQARLGTAEVEYVEGASTTELNNLDQAVVAAQKSDVAIVCLGETPYTEIPGDVDNLNLPNAQIELVEAIAATGTPVVLVLVQGRPRVISAIEGLADGIVNAYLPGNEGGPALAEILVGVANPSGKLPFTYPRYSASLLTYDHKGTDQINRDFSYTAFNPQFAFGHGLSYTEFSYSNLKLDQSELSEGGSLTVSVMVENIGDRRGKEVVQLYVTDKVASITPPVERLRAFRKITLDPGQSQTVSFTLTAQDLAFVGWDQKMVTEPGDFELRINELKESFVYKSAAAAPGKN
ncbi:MAG: glycoside hydrolase family 3 N-terminal domain-containing protein [Salibacteraceae bacterium]